MIEIFPSLKYPPLQSCKDYPESLSYKYHLAYLLGEALSKADKIWYKGGYFTLNKKIKEAKHIYKLHQEYKAKLQELHLSYCFIPKEFLLDSLSFLKAIETLMHKLKSQENNSFKIESFFFKLFSQIPFSTQTPFLLKHKEEILQWLNSKEFKEQYIKTNHSYPPLLNPDRLNAKRESKECNVESQRENRDSIQSYPNLSYESIPAELAWDLNLPLPRNYCGILVFFGLSGHLALLAFLYQCGASIISLSNTRYAKKDYYAAYQTLLTNHINFLTHINYMQDKENRKHIFALADAKVPVLINLRDPIGRLKHGINHGWYKSNQWIYEINQHKEALDRVTYGGQDKPHLDLLESVLKNKNIGNISIWEYHQTIQEIRNASSIHYLDMQEIVGKRTFDTMTQLSQEFRFPLPKEEDRKFYESKINNQYRYLLPIIFRVNEEIKILVEQSTYNIEFILGLNLSSSIVGGFLAINDYNKNELLNHTFSILQDNMDIISQLNLDSLGLQIKILADKKQSQEIAYQANHSNLKNDLQQYLFALKEKIQSIETNKVTESQVLEYLKEHKDLRKIYQTYFEKEFVHIKQVRPDIVESWKYYQEFERMCAELD